MHRVCEMTLTRTAKGGRTWPEAGWASAGGRAATASCRRPRTPVGPEAADPASGPHDGSSLQT
jgi:hypothetical protein